MKHICPRIVLVRPSHPGNIGAVARAMKTMGLSDLFLVAPVKPIDDSALALATHGKDVLENAICVNHISEALQGVHKVYATSANVRGIELSSFTPREAVKKIRENEMVAFQKVAILFGPENHGLSNEDLGFAHALIKIPTSSDYHSLNLASAVQIVAYEYLLTKSEDYSQQEFSGLSSSVEWTDMTQMQFFYAHLESLLIKIKFLDPEKPRQLMPKLRRLFNRAHLKENEVKILRGIIKAVEDALDARRDRFI